MCSGNIYKLQTIFLRYYKIVFSEFYQLWVSISSFTMFLHNLSVISRCGLQFMVYSLQNRNQSLTKIRLQWLYFNFLSKSSMWLSKPAPQTRRISTSASLVRLTPHFSDGEEMALGHDQFCSAALLTVHLLWHGHFTLSQNLC